MKLEEFNNIQIGDEVYLPDTNREGKFMSTEVLEINRENQTLKVFMDSNKFRPYEYVMKSVPFENISCSVGFSTSPRMAVWKMIAILSSPKLDPYE